MTSLHADRAPRGRGFPRLRRHALIFILGAGLALPSVAYDVPGMRDAMREVFSSMRLLLELSADPRQLEDPANEDAILSATTELADQAAMISEHAARDELSFLAGSLDRYANWIRRSYEWRRIDSMTGLIRDAVELCVACHTRLPSAGDSPLADDFIAGQDISTLPAASRARLQIATRRFADALDTLETALPAAAGTPRFFGTLRSYLVVALRVKRDPARARRTLMPLISGDALPAPERDVVKTLIAALDRLEAKPPAPGDLAAARALVRAAENAGGANGPSGMVDYVAASRLLYEFLEAGKGAVEEGAEAYYLLGLTRYRLEREAWLPQAELYLEKAIRTAPGSGHAQRALALLEAQLEERLGKTGSGLPQDVVRHLEMLRELAGPGG